MPKKQLINLVWKAAYKYLPHFLGLRHRPLRHGYSSSYLSWASSTAQRLILHSNRLKKVTYLTTIIDGECTTIGDRAIIRCSVYCAASIVSNDNGLAT